MANRLTLAPGSSDLFGLAYWEPLVDGQPLRMLLGDVDTPDDLIDLSRLGPSGDMVPVLVHNWPVPDTDYALELLGEKAAVLDGGRAPVYVCAACGDLAWEPSRWQSSGQSARWSGGTSGGTPAGMTTRGRCDSQGDRSCSTGVATKPNSGASWTRMTSCGRRCPTGCLSQRVTSAHDAGGGHVEVDADVPPTRETTQVEADRAALQRGSERNYVMGARRSSAQSPRPSTLAPGKPAGSVPVASMIRRVVA